MNCESLIKQIGERLNIHAFRAHFDIDVIDAQNRGAVPSRAAFIRGLEAAMKRLACTCGIEYTQQKKHVLECPYDRLMNTNRPPVFVIRNFGNSSLSNGKFAVDFTFMGDSHQLLPFMILAIEEMVVKFPNSEVSKLRLLEVLTLPEEKRVYTGNDRKLELGKISPLGAEYLVFDESVSKATVKFIYPLNLEYSGNSGLIPEFSNLVLCLCRRLDDMLPGFWSDKVIHELPGFKEALERVRLVQMRLKWRKTPHTGYGGLGKAGGIIGFAVYAGQLKPFIPLLRIGEQIGIDNGSWMNSGLIQIDKIE